MKWLGDHDGLSTRNETAANQNFEDLKAKGLKLKKLSFNKDKDQSDLSLALELLKTQFKGEDIKVLLHGFSGGRLDHQLAIIGELHLFLKSNSNKARTIIYDEQGYCVAEGTTGTFSGEHIGEFSVFTLEKEKITISGNATYTGDFELGPLSSLGLSNRAKGCFKVASSLPFFIIWNLTS